MIRLAPVLVEPREHVLEDLDFATRQRRCPQGRDRVQDSEVVG